MPSNFQLRRTADPALDDLQQRVKAEFDRMEDHLRLVATLRPQLYGLAMNGRNGGGYVAVPVVRDSHKQIVRRARAGDVVAQVIDFSTGVDHQADFEPVVSKTDSLRQVSTSNLSGTLLYVIFTRVA